MNKDEQNLNLLSIFHYIVGGLTAIFACIPIIHIVAGISMLTSLFESEQPPLFFTRLFILLSVIFIMVGWAISIAIIVAARKLKRRTSRTFCLVVAGLECFFIPFGTVLGAFTFVILTKESVKELFANTQNRLNYSTLMSVPLTFFKSFLLGCVSAILICFMLGYVMMKSRDVTMIVNCPFTMKVFPTTGLFDDLLISKTESDAMGQILFLIDRDYIDSPIASLSFDSGIFKYFSFNSLDKEYFGGTYSLKNKQGLPTFSLIIDKAFYMDIDCNGVFDMKSSGKKNKKIWLGNSWVPATLVKKSMGRAKVGSVVYNFNRITGEWEVTDESL